MDARQGLPVLAAIHEEWLFRQRLLAALGVEPDGG